MVAACGGSTADPLPPLASTEAPPGTTTAVAVPAPQVPSPAVTPEAAVPAPEAPPPAVATEAAAPAPEAPSSRDGPLPDLPTTPLAPPPAAPPPALPPEPPPPTTTTTTRPPFPPTEVEWEPATILISQEGVDEIVPVYDAPDGNRLTFPDGELWSYTYRGNRLVVRVTQGAEGDEWVEAELPIRPNGVRGWIRTENFNWSTVSHHILVDVSDRSIALFDGDELITHSRVLVGKPDTPTPTLSGFIVEKLPNHNQQNASVVLGDWILMLSFFSEALNSFGGGLPRIALKGTHIPERVGEALSNGGARIPNDIIEVIAQEAPLGTAVNVVA